MAIYASVAREVEPKRLKLKLAQQTLDSKLESLESAKEKLDEVQRMVQELKDQYDASTREKEEVRRQYDGVHLQVGGDRQKRRRKLRLLGTRWHRWRKAYSDSY